MNCKIIACVLMPLLIGSCTSTEVQRSVPVTTPMDSIPTEASGPPDPAHQLVSLDCNRGKASVVIEQESKSHSWRAFVFNRPFTVIAFAQSEKTFFFKIDSDLLREAVSANLFVDEDGTAGRGELRCSNVEIRAVSP